MWIDAVPAVPLSVRPNAVGLLEVHPQRAGEVGWCRERSHAAHGPGSATQLDWKFSDVLGRSRMIWMDIWGKLCLKMFKGSLVRKLPYGRMSRGSLAIIMSTT